MTQVLDSLTSPDQIQDFSVKELEELAKACRKKIIDVVSRTGGHLASSLGTVELTLALAKVFDLKEDKVIFDVGHQGYTYKLITGRKDRLVELGKKGGISKFLSRKESPYDHFGAGHASTSISAALGFTVARRLAGKAHHCIAVIGDGAMTGGLAFEALNHAGHLDDDLIVILNDNEMSIDPVVGALSKTIINISASKSFNLIRSEISKHSTDGAIPKAIHQTFKRINDSFMAFFTHGVWFENLNFRYFGQVDGHNLEDLINVLKATKHIQGPILIHLMTQKGKGYRPAEGDALSYHGIGAFDPETGKPIPKGELGKSYTNLFSESMERLMEADPKVLAISAAMLGNTGLARLQSRFPERIFDVGIAEGHAVTFAAGLAAEGFKPFVVVYSTFLQRALDHIVHDVALQGLPVRFILDRAGFVGADGATHHGVLDLTYLRMIPKMAILAPKNGKELQGMLKMAHEYQEGPLAIRFPRDNSLEFWTRDQEVQTYPWGKAELLAPAGELVVVAVGSMVDTALALKEKLALSGVRAGVINARFVKPLDQELILDQLKGAKGLVTLEENAVAGGFGSGVLEMLSQAGVHKPALVLGIKDAFFEHATREEQLAETGLDLDSVLASVLDFFRRLS
ncbi:MAG: 1-deoxy-D-xylulose-5-phosphate synthase [Candidatus Lambdaproteobacteria bacterium RIFOXYD1_FULL_56_27]|uniref:1-deoxy-D-xylulose-5-phosphate synthase n=1 Tax=Candidatus Lambdaproteobacteria bacterium RIFOXYD2_FULL_56_26 TaxID=1817773 RepID=A0A1F6H225_9PROT|nr:MAG: 1-deoxy-D-xylulose-5-phosphate synthase [Candidatus Lambdaproteobacteria bacterium RIFOXYC1_FULL_56_13]OGH04344.1 MAG: 1-deoxy-D-xylulose-5-phosphate synthase [Candidatus Lambdaproteobacteria bacterium RIFOXYD2_FULL_56_26]OGH08681.1 MAG: 1-deoxy-D-xylulose-5-phosphate synthase [Candidatus Lambdaproteobacteria bacterium RIFOXYD1_FULL_56_27]